MNHFDEKLYEDSVREIALWRAVIWQALSDISATKEEIEKNRAIAWLIRPHSDFKRVCEFALLDWQKIKEIAELRMNQLSGKATYGSKNKLLRRGNPSYCVRKPKRPFSAWV